MQRFSCRRILSQSNMYELRNMGLCKVARAVPVGAVLAWVGLVGGGIGEEMGAEIPPTTRAPQREVLFLYQHDPPRRLGVGTHKAPHGRPWRPGARGAEEILTRCRSSARALCDDV